MTIGTKYAEVLTEKLKPVIEAHTACESARKAEIEARTAVNARAVARRDAVAAWLDALPAEIREDIECVCAEERRR